MLLPTETWLAAWLWLSLCTSCSIGQVVSASRSSIQFTGSF
jgi:hypothetical protein